jgi:hypothetical protein
MNNSMRNIVCCLTAVILIVTTSGCDWMFPLTSPGRAKVDKRLLGFWKLTYYKDVDPANPTPKPELVYSVSECAKLSQVVFDANPELPRGAMFTTFTELNVFPNASNSFGLCWPTQIGSTSYLNLGGYNTKAKKLQTAANAYIIFKYVVTGDSLTLYNLTDDAKKRIRSSLGSNYNSADLLQEISKATEWEKGFAFARIRL